MLKQTQEIARIKQTKIELINKVSALFESYIKELEIQQVV